MAGHRRGWHRSGCHRGGEALGSAPAAAAAYSVTQHNASVTVAVNRPSGVAGANAALHAIGARVSGRPGAARLPADRVTAAPPAAPHLYVSVWPPG